MSEGIELPEIKVSPSNRIAVSNGPALVDPNAEQVPEIARRCNNWDEVQARLETAVELSVARMDDDAMERVEQALDIMRGREAERLIGGEV